MPLGTSNFAFTYEDYSKMVYARAFDGYLLKEAQRFPAAEAFSLRRVTTLETSANPAEGATTSETDMKGEAERKDLQTFRSQQTVSNELLADSDAMKAIALLLGQEIEEHLSYHCVDACEAISYNPAAGGSYRDNVLTGTTNGAFTTAQFLTMCYGQDTTVNNLAAGVRFTAEQRKSLVWISSPSTMTAWIGSVPTPNPLPNLPVAAIERGSAAVMGIPLVPLNGGILLNSATTKGGLHALAVDTKQIVIAEQPLMIVIDTESKAENNQSVIHAVYRASAFLTHRSNCTGITLRSMV